MRGWYTYQIIFASLAKKSIVEIFEYFRNFYQKSIRKLIFLMIFGKIFTDLRQNPLMQIILFFYNIFSGSEGFIEHPTPPCVCQWLLIMKGAFPKKTELS